MPTAGAIMLDADGKRMLRPSGKLAIIPNDGECPPCCAPALIQIIGGGSDGAGTGFLFTALDDHWEYDAGAGTYTAKATIPAPTALMGSWNINGKLYIHSGGAQTAVTSNIYVDDTREYDPATDSWAVKADVPSPVRAYVASFAIDGIGYSAGGHRNTTSFPPQFLDTDAYNPGTNSWAAKANTPSPERSHAAGSPTGVDSGLMCGGIKTFPSPTNSVTHQDVDAYFNLSDSWLAKSSLPFPDRSAAASALLDDHVFVMYGWRGGAPGTVLRDCDGYDVLLETWASKADGPLPTRQQVRAAAAKNQIICFGGTNGSDWKTDVDAYTPGDNTWTSLSNMTIPGRFGGAVLAR